ncbi:MAG: VWA domain-containing protein [bacterium]|nr:VWA domain-containing protein [bacterium]
MRFAAVFQNSPMTRHFATTALLVGLVLAPSGMTEAAGLLVADGGFGGVLEIEEHSVEVTFNNGIVVTEVTQVFRNTENRQVEALYTFPVPEGASVANFSMWINGKEMVGEVVEKERARQIYNSYKQQRRDPGLLEQVDYKTFEMRIFPIGPGAEQRVQIAYYQELDFDHDWATFVYPLATATRNDLDSRTRGRFAMNLNVSSEVPIVAVESPSHGDDFVIAKHGSSFVQASLESSGGDLNRDVVLAFQLERPHTGLDLVTSKGPGEDGFFQLTLTAGKELEDLVEAMDYVFVMDISGSMGEDGKLALSRNQISAFVNELGDNDRFEVMSFNVNPETVFGQLRAVEDVTRRDAVAFLESRRAKGGTVLRPALQLAYQYKADDRPLNVIVLSDGMTEQRERATLLSVVGQRPRSTRVYCIGVGNEVNRPLLEQIAEEAGGLAAFLSRGDDITRQAKAFRRKLVRPVGTNLEITIDEVGAYDIGPAKLPNLFHGSPLRLYGRYRGDGIAKVHIQATLGGEMLDQWVELDFSDSNALNPEIERMWAFNRIEGLLREADRGGSRAKVVDEVIRLGEGFSIVTEYTSFLVLENDAEYQRWKIERRNALRIERDRTQQQRVRSRLEKLRDEAAAALGPMGLPDKAEQPSTADTNSADSSARPEGASPAGPRRQVDVGPRRDSGSGGGGGGALDPLSAGLAILIAGLIFAVSRVRQ